MKSVILKTPSRIILQVMVLVSFFMLLRGHDLPGGGFIGGLIAACALVLFHLSQNKRQPGRETLLRYWPHVLSAGILCLVVSSTVSILMGHAFFTGLWLKCTIWGYSIKTGTFLLFDLGIYFLVISSVAIMIEALE